MMIKTLWGIVLALTINAVHAASLESIQRNGLIVIGVRDSSPPFSLLDPQTRILKGYDIEFAQGIAKRLNVKPVFRTLESNDRLPWLQQGKADIVVAVLSRTPEREKLVDFSVGYFVTDTRVLAKKGRFKSEQDLAGAYLTAVNASTGAKLIRQSFAKTKLAEFDDVPETIKALNADIVEGVVDDAPVLAMTLNKMPEAQRQRYAISDFALALEVYAVGMPKGEKTLQAAINRALVEMETSGEAAAIFNRWFGPQSNAPISRIFKISPSRN
ncbi:transporter substrate-binding domain-containing protein [Chitinibacter sp. GC72]|uniref:transporter substrate-binding domain-containing protein n=1 Tax=Chitinibacter sp. GC72 TaxID=1526917 RepID=UPI0012F954CD|nr:transporter substrate-binding domain-containing protein [Chitinibacter sp. GC72]